MILDVNLFCDSSDMRVREIKMKGIVGSSLDPHSYRKMCLPVG